MKKLLSAGCFLLVACAPVAAQPAAPRRAVLVDIDGIRRDTFAKAYEQGKLPNFQRVFGEALWYDNAATVLPSVTMSAQASIITGAAPSRHGVPGNQWYDRDSGRLWNYLNTSGITCVYGFTVLAGPVCVNGIGNAHVQSPTLYEAAAAAGLSSLAVYMPYWKGASRPSAPTAAETALFLKGNTLDYRAFDTQMTSRAVADIRAQGLPAILALYFGGADLVGHRDGIAAQTPYLSEVIDPLFGRVLDAIAQADPQWSLSTMILLTSDHGRTDVTPHDEDIQLDKDLASVLPPNSHIAPNGGIVYVYLDPPDSQTIAEVAGKLAGNAKFSATIASVRPRAASDPARAGDLILTLKHGHYDGNASHGSQHGSVYADDLGVPVVISIPGMAGRHIADPVRITQVARTIAQYLGFPMDSADPPLPLPPR